MQSIPLHRFYHASGIIAAILLTLLVLGTATGRTALAWIYLQPTETVTNATHIRHVPSGQVGPDLPAVHVVQPQEAL